MNNRRTLCYNNKVGSYTSFSKIISMIKKHIHKMYMSFNRNKKSKSCSYYSFKQNFKTIKYKMTF